MQSSKLLNFVLFPFRALFLPEESKWGLLSLRDERMKAVASYCTGKVLDVGCGPGNYFINHFIGTSNGLGIDVYPYDGIEHVVDDMSFLPFGDSYYDSVTLIAVGGHIPKSKRLAEFKERFALSQGDLDKNGAFTKIVKAAVLRDVLSGIVPQRMSVDGHIPINFQKGEQVVWAFAGSKYLEDKTRRQFVGGSQGVSIRVMKGVYYRVGAFKGHAVEHTERVHIDTGWVVVTTKNIYFAGPRKSVRLPYAKIISFEPFSDGVGVMRDAATAKPQIFVTGDGWFTYNLVTNLSQL